jgi:membrane-bound lytic murein transglycosylase D
MIIRRYSNHFVIASGLLVAFMTAAWTVGRSDVPIEPPPMEDILETATVEEAEVVTWDLPVTRNESVDMWINFLAGRNAERTQLWLERKGAYGPMIRAELRARGMPEDLLYLALIESGLSPRAYSKAAASGMWQFIAETGQRYGLEVNADVDERRDPIKSTSAALDYLTYLYNRFDSWYLAAAAYNTGENRVGRIMRETFGSEKGTDDQFWKIAHRLPRETRDYVPLMLAAGHIGKEPHEVRLRRPEVPGSPEVRRGLGTGRNGPEPHRRGGRRQRRRRGGAEPAPHAQAYAVQPRWSVRIPHGTKVAFDAAFPELYRTARLSVEESPRLAAIVPGAGSSGAATTAARTHRVRSGETMDRIARNYGISVSVLRSANSSVNPRRMRVGQVLQLRGGAATQPAARVHRVRRGENLSVIASRYGVTVRQLQAWNGLRGSRIIAGQRLQRTGVIPLWRGSCIQPTAAHSPGAKPCTGSRSQSPNMSSPSGTRGRSARSWGGGVRRTAPNPGRATWWSLPTARSSA